MFTKKVTLTTEKFFNLNKSQKQRGKVYLVRKKQFIFLGSRTGHSSPSNVKLNKEQICFPRYLYASQCSLLDKKEEARDLQFLVSLLLKKYLSFIH